MGTRYDFYVGRGPEAEWLGSGPFDGYPGGVFDNAPELFAEPPVTEAEWRSWVAEHLSNEDRATTPDMGWPWPWNDSRTTDYAYAWEDGAIFGCAFGAIWFRVDPTGENWGEPEYEGGKQAVFPNMAERKSVTYGPRSGLIVFGIDR